MSNPIFLENLKKKPNLNSSPNLIHLQESRPNSQAYPFPKEFSATSKPINNDTKPQENYRIENRALKTDYHTNSHNILPANNYKYDGYGNTKNTDLSSKKYGNLKNSHFLSQNKDSQLTADGIQTETEKKRSKIPRVSMPNFIADLNNNQIQPEQEFNDNLTKNEKEQFFPKKKISEKETKSPIDYKERLAMRKSSTDVSRHWESQFSPKKKQKKRVFTLMDFEQVQELGAGKYGKVFLVKQKSSSMMFALKIIEKKQLIQEEITEQFIRELKIQLFLNHPNIIKMYGFFDDPVNIYIILEVGMGGQLFKYMKKNIKLPENKVAILMRQICQAVNQLHANQIIHRDIKPQNIVLHDNIVKLCDFGWSVYRDQKLRSTFCGTPLYVCPQILRGKEYDEKIDIWSLGVMMYQMLIGENPFKIQKQEDLIRIVKQSINIPQFAKISPQATDFLHCCLQKKPQDRKNIRQLLNHDFFKKYPQKTSEKKVAL